MSWNHLRTSEVKGRKQYVCENCKEYIPKGESHIYRVGVDGGEINGFRMHKSCSQFSNTWDVDDWEYYSHEPYYTFIEDRDEFLKKNQQSIS